MFKMSAVRDLRNRRHLRNVSVGTVLLMVIPVVASCGSVASPVRSSSLPSKETKGTVFAPGKCGASNHSIGMMVELAPGHSDSDLASYRLVVAGSVSASQEDLRIVTGQDGSALPTVSTGLMTAGIVSAEHEVLPQSHVPTLISCRFDLSDAPAAQPYIAAARQAALARGAATQADLDSPGTIDLISDDPFRSGNLIVTLDVPDQVVPGGPPGGRNHRAILVIESVAAGVVLGLGTGRWPQ